MSACQPVNKSAPSLVVTTGNSADLPEPKNRDLSIPISKVSPNASELPQPTVVSHSDHIVPTVGKVTEVTYPATIINSSNIMGHSVVEDRTTFVGVNEKDVETNNNTDDRFSNRTNYKIESLNEQKDKFSQEFATPTHEMHFSLTRTKRKRLTPASFIAQLPEEIW